MYYLSGNGVEKSVETWNIIVPLFDNDKNKFPKNIIAAVKSKVVQEFGGLTEINVIGQWQSGKELYTDRNIQIIVDIPVKDHLETSAFFLGLKDNLRKELKQEKIYVKLEKSSSELLTFSEFLQELGFEVSYEQSQSFTQDNIKNIIEQLDKVQIRSDYHTLKITRDIRTKNIIWEREILGMRLVTNINDCYPIDVYIVSADKLETYFTKEHFGKPLVVIGDYEYQSFILDKNKIVHLLDPDSFVQYIEENGEPKYEHEWHGRMDTSEFIPTYIEELLVNYVILREMRNQDKIIMNVGSNGEVDPISRTG